MHQDEPESCGSLQAEWTVDEVLWAKGGVTIRASRSISNPLPDPVDRPGHLVMAEPRVFREEKAAEIHFKSVEWCQIVDEFSFATGQLETAGDPEQFTGRYFRCLSESLLLTSLRRARTDQAAARLKHYRLLTENDVIDIVSTEPPEVVIRGPRVARR